MLETNFNWNGILCEPAKIWKKALSENRRCKIDERCVWSKTGETISFQEMESGGLSGIAREFTEFNGTIIPKKRRTYLVETVSLTDLLKDSNAPKIIEYLSIDTEGSEFEILSQFDFTEFRFNFITLEHNYSPNRIKVQELLGKAGYVTVLPELSMYEDWFIHKDRIDDFNLLINS